MKKTWPAIIVMALIIVSCSKPGSRLFVGGFSATGDSGLAIFDFNDRTGELKMLLPGNAGPNPAYFCYSQKNSLLYVANEVTDFGGSKAGGLTTWLSDESASSLKKMGEMAVPFGGPCYISISPDSGHIFLANYPSGSVAVVRLDSAGIPETITDTILYERDSVNVSHAHMILNDPSGELIYVSDLGHDRIIRYKFRRDEGKLNPSDTLFLPDGAGPRHFEFGSGGKILYVINELGSTISVFSLTGEPNLLQTVRTTRDDFTGKSFCADIHMGKDGRFIYGSNRGENTIVVFAVQPDGTLKLAGHNTCGGNWPRNFVIDNSGKFLLVGNQRSDTVAVFSIDEKTGIPAGSGRKYYAKAPACLKFY